MAMAKTRYLEGKILDHVLRNIPYTPPTTIYLALFTADPGEAGSLAAEITDPAYQRKAVTFSTAVDDVESGKLVKSTIDLDFAQATTEWGTVTHVMLMDAPTEGNGLYYGTVTNPKAISVGDFIKVPASELVVKED